MHACLQVAFLGTYSVYTTYDKVGTGIWGGVIFFATAVYGVAWTMDGKDYRCSKYLVQHNKV